MDLMSPFYERWQRQIVMEKMRGILWFTSITNSKYPGHKDNPAVDYMTSSSQISILRNAPMKCSISLM